MITKKKTLIVVLVLSLGLVLAGCLSTSDDIVDDSQDEEIVGTPVQEAVVALEQYSEDDVLT